MNREAGAVEYAVPHSHTSRGSWDTACSICGESVGHSNHAFTPEQVLTAKPGAESSVKRRQSVEDMAHAAMKKPHARFVKSIGEGETEFTNGYTWGFVEGYRAARKAALRGKR